MMDDCLKSSGAPPVWGKDANLKSFTKDASTAQNRVTPEAARNNDQFDSAAAKGKVGGAAQIPALNPAASSTAIWTMTKRLKRPQPDLDAGAFHRDALNCKAIWRQAGALKLLAHSQLLRRISKSVPANRSKCESEPILNENPGSVRSENQHEGQ
jgi:hypothetical protein